MMENEREKVKGDGFCSYLSGVTTNILSCRISWI